MPFFLSDSLIIGGKNDQSRMSYAIIQGLTDGQIFSATLLNK